MNEFQSSAILKRKGASFARQCVRIAQLLANNNLANNANLSSRLSSPLLSSPLSVP